MSLQALFPSIASDLPSQDGSGFSAAGDFEVLALALNTTGLTDTVSALEGATIFAPTDAAFAHLASLFGFEGDAEDPAAVLDAITNGLTNVAEDGDPMPLLNDLLLYHISPGNQTTADLNNTGPVHTLQGDAVFEVTGNTVIDVNVDVTNAEIVSADITAGTNTLQIVDKVILPFSDEIEGEDPTIFDELKESGGFFDEDTQDFDILLNSLQATGLDVELSDDTNDLTIFLPTDQAFIDLAQSMGLESNDEGSAFAAILQASAEANPDDPLAMVTDILTYHITPGAKVSSELEGVDQLEMMNGAALDVDAPFLTDQSDQTDDAEIIEPNIIASNGIAHVIDEVLLPGEGLPVDDQDNDDDYDDGHDDDDYDDGHDDDDNDDGHDDDDYDDGHDDDDYDDGHDDDDYDDGHDDDDYDDGHDDDDYDDGHDDDDYDDGHDDDDTPGNGDDPDDDMDGDQGGDMPDEQPADPEDTAEDDDDFGFGEILAGLGILGAVAMAFAGAG